ncbi:hypothetical protein BKA67DRAFT_121209 [Truncatella angustata]|uniref:Uncharacterized protein n=1 Tax=Truncatella angustata TaxID=152316 RepID=A0A9P8UB77_9PEZI|nr:uncharacterized protein BKA67DRAFT_121209 [Truncatella angustata]KAH6645647.1 hypothetical protein BKA67DRAFT_121209 [Truncatella angustata]
MQQCCLLTVDQGLSDHARSNAQSTITLPFFFEWIPPKDDVNNATSSQNNQKASPNADTISMATSTRDESPASASPISVHKPRSPRRQDFADTNCRSSGSMSEMSNPAATARDETSGFATGWESMRDGTLRNDSKAHRNWLPFDSSPYVSTNQTIGPEHEVGASHRSSLARNPGSTPFPSGCCSVCILTREIV